MRRGGLTMDVVGQSTEKRAIWLWKPVYQKKPEKVALASLAKVRGRWSVLLSAFLLICVFHLSLFLLSLSPSFRMAAATLPSPLQCHAHDCFGALLVRICERSKAKESSVKANKRKYTFLVGSINQCSMMVPWKRNDSQPSKHSQ